MKVILTNETELTPIMVTGAQKYVQGVNRDSLTFVFAEVGLDEIDGVFTEENCESITIIGDDESEAIHNGYVIRTDLTKKLVVTQTATSETEEVTENRVMVTMAQRTYAETQMRSMQEEITNTQLALCEIYEGGLE